MPYDYDVREQYTMSLCKEIERFAKEHADEYVVNSVFFGGGTPSILEPELFEKIISTVRDNFKMNTDSEITIECNPGTVTYDKLGTYKENGVNRISFGLQSANDSELKALEGFILFRILLSRMIMHLKQVLIILMWISCQRCQVRALRDTEIPWKKY